MLPPEYCLRRANAGGFHSPTTGNYVQMGTPGQADLTGEIRGGFRLEVEVKRPGGKLSEKQKRYRDHCEAMGVTYLVVHSLEEFLEEIQESLVRLGVRGRA